MKIFAPISAVFTNQPFPKIPHGIPHLILDSAAIESTINSMSMASALGLDGLRSSHLRQLLSADSARAREAFLST